MALLRQVVVDCRTSAALAQFWAAALDDFAVRPYDAAEIARLAEHGFTRETDPCVIVDGPHVELCFQQVTVEPRTKTPVHLDIASSDWLAEVDRLQVCVNLNPRNCLLAHEDIVGQNLDRLPTVALGSAAMSTAE